MTGQNRQRIEFEARLDLVPEEPGVYLMRDVSGSVLYVGKANSLRQRLRNYFTPVSYTHLDVYKRQALNRTM